MKRNQKEEND